MTEDVPLAPLHERLGIEIRHLSASCCVATMPVSGNTQPYGLLHGGATAALIEGTASVAASCHAGAGRAPVGVDLNVTHLAAVRSGTVTATAKAVRLGSTTAVYTVDVVDDSGRLSAVGRLTCQLRPIT